MKTSYNIITFRSKRRANNYILILVIIQAEFFTQSEMNLEKKKSIPPRTSSSAGLVCDLFNRCTSVGGAMPFVAISS